MSFRYICPQVRMSAIRMRIAGKTLHEISTSLDVNVATVHVWTNFVPHPNRRKNNNIIINAKRGVVGKLKRDAPPQPKWRTLLGVLAVAKVKAR